LAKKRVVKTTIYIKEVPVTYIGRFLGFLRPNEYAKTIGNPAITSRMETRNTKNLFNVCHRMGNLNNARFVLALKEGNGKTLNKKLLISEPMDFISEIKYVTKSVTMHAVSGNEITLSESEEELT
jgi:hypothetical protein